MKVIQETAEAGFSLDMKNGAWIKAYRSVTFEYPEGEKPSDEKIRELLLGKLREDFVYYSKGVAGANVTF